MYKESYLSHQEEMEYYHFVENHLQQSEVVHQLNSPSFHCGISSHLPYKMELKGLLDGCSHYYFCLYRYYKNKHTKNKLRIITSKQTYLTKRLYFIIKAKTEDRKIDRHTIKYNWKEEKFYLETHRQPLLSSYHSVISFHSQIPG